MKGKAVFVMFFSVIHLTCIAQVEVKDWQINFASNVHSMDEFFDRFNFKRNSAFERYLKKYFQDVTFTRDRLVYSLFNKKNSDFSDNKQVEEFVKQVTDSFSPDFIYYADKYWYAQLNCMITYQNKPQPLELILKVEQPKRNMFQWSIVSAKADFLNDTSLNMMQRPLTDKNVTTENPGMYFLSPASHGIDFMNIDDFFISSTRTSIQR